MKFETNFVLIWWHFIANVHKSLESSFKLDEYLQPCDILQLLKLFNEALLMCKTYTKTKINPYKPNSTMRIVFYLSNAWRRNKFQPSQFGFTELFPTVDITSWVDASKSICSFSPSLVIRNTNNLKIKKLIKNLRSRQK